MKRTNNFTLHGIANDFRFIFTNRLSNKALENSWRSSMSVATNEAQNAFYFSQSIKFDTDRTVEAVYRDIMDVIKSIREEEWIFDLKTIRKGYEIEVTNLRRSEVVALDIDWASEMRKLDEDLSKKYGVKIVDKGRMNATISGGKKMVRDFLLSCDYAMSVEELEKSFHELCDQNGASVGLEAFFRNGE